MTVTVNNPLPTPVALSDGGTGVALSDPNIDRVVTWDDSAGQVKFAALTDINTEATPASGDFVLMYDAAGNLLKTDWANLPGAGAGISNVVEDTTPQLGGDLDLNGKVITDTSTSFGIASSVATVTSGVASGFCASQIVAQTDVSDFAYSEFRLSIKNPDFSSTPKRLFTFGGEGTYTDAGSLTSHDFYIYDDTLPGYLLYIAPGDIELLDLTTIFAQTAATNTVAYPLTVRHQTSATPATGIGVGMQFVAETSASNYEIGAVIDAVTTDATATSEDFDLVFKTMAAGAAAAENFRIKSTSVLVSPTGQVAHFWVYWTGASTTILASHNVTSIDNDATGDAGINLTTAFSSNNYAAFVCTNETGTDGWDADSIQSCGINVHTTATVDVLCGVMIDGTTAVGNTTNPDQWQAVGFGVSA